MSAQKSTQIRLFFFDNLRSLMVILVLIFHSGASYGSMVSFWPFHDPNPMEFIDILMLLGDVFMMTILFFVAGYFALDTIQKKGSKNFLMGKVMRIGIPWLAITVLVLPVLDYIHYATQSNNVGFVPRNFGMHWWLSMRKIAEFKIGRMHMSEYLNMTDHFYQRYMWFLSLLLLLFIIFTIFYKATRNQGWYAEKDTTSRKSIRFVLAGTALLSIALFSIVKLFVSSPDNPFDMVWFSLGNILQFELAKLAFYVPCFGLGVYARARKWFTEGRDIGRPGVWGWIVFVLLILNMFVGRAMTRSLEPSWILQIAFLALYPLWTLSFLGFFISFAANRWNASSRFNRELASNSYGMYLAHYVFVMTLPLLLSGWVGGNVLINFGLVSITTIILSYLVSRYMIQLRPRVLVAGMISLNLLLVVFR
ncbi:MAG TPA: acyltransferase family protein [Anaerolineales bacterium]|nr:acyltransferase family protein [Anaerolineales bacterium]